MQSKISELLEREYVVNVARYLASLLNVYTRFEIVDSIARAREPGDVFRHLKKALRYKYALASEKEAAEKEGKKVWIFIVHDKDVKEFMKLLEELYSSSKKRFRDFLYAFCAYVLSMYRPS